MGHKRWNGHKWKRMNEEFPTAPTAPKCAPEFPERHEVSRWHTESFLCARGFWVSDEENAPRSRSKFPKEQKTRSSEGYKWALWALIGILGKADTHHRPRSEGFPTAQARHGSPCGNGLCGEENWAWHFSEYARQYAKPRIFFLTQPSAFEQDDGCEALIGCSLVLRHEVR